MIFIDAVKSTSI